ncbi:hypothetical protein [Endozoicomonas atrinae]|uniref:hypothetical protein n=1 Tax=Endozoicomonas atrinae TaxID=1333660 RepID=UPI003B00DDC8
MKRWQNNIPEYLISPLTTGFRKISIGVVKDSFTLAFLSFCIMLAEEAKACFSPWSTCWLHSSLEFEKSQKESRAQEFH